MVLGDSHKEASAGCWAPCLVVPFHPYQNYKKTATHGKTHSEQRQWQAQAQDSKKGGGLMRSALPRKESRASSQ